MAGSAASCQFLPCPRRYWRLRILGGAAHKDFKSERGHAKRIDVCPTRVRVSSRFELVVNGDDGFKLAANHLALGLGGGGRKALGLQAAPPATDPVHERDVVQLAFVGGIRLKIGIGGDPIHPLAAAGVTAGCHGGR